MHTLVLITINLHTKFELFSFTHSTDMMWPKNLTSGQRIMTKG